MNELYTNLIENLNQVIEVVKIQNIDYLDIFKQPVILIQIFINAFLIVLFINIVSKLLCKVFFYSSDSFKRTLKAKKLDKTLKDMYPNNKKIYS